MRKWLKYSCILFVGCISTANADDNSLIRNFLESCYLLPYDPKTEMTDVILVNAYYYTDQSQIKALANEVVEKYATNPSSVKSNNLLGDVFMSASMSNNAVIHLFRERTIADYYRLDSAGGLKTFVPYSWDDGQFTNKHSLYVNNISTPPQETNGLWTLYSTQPAYSEVDIQTGEKPLLFNEGFYINIFGLPPLIKMNVILQTADAKKGVGTHIVSNNDPAGFSWFTPDEKRMDEVLNGKGKFGSWSVTSLAVGVKQLSLFSPDGIDRNLIRVVFNASNPQQRYLAYVREPNINTIIALFAWDYDENGKPVRFLRIERGGDDKLKAWAQYIIHVDKTTNIDWSLFNVDLTKFKTVYDKRPKYPIETKNGKVVFDASKDKYAPLPNKAKSHWFDKTTIIRTIIFTVLLMPPLIMILAALKKRTSK